MQQIGIYEKLITQLISESLDKDVFYIGERLLEPADATLWLSRFLSKILEFAVGSVPGGKDQLQGQIALANQLLMWLKDRIQDDGFIEENLLDSQGRILTALYELKNPVAANLKQYIDDIYPLTGLSESELFCGNNAGLSLESELKREILSSDKIYWLVSFIKWAGIRIFRQELEEFTRSGRELRVITTSYMGATDAKAVEFLASLPNTRVKLSYNTQQERLHAKSYMFIRNTGFNTGYIGSSNLSHSALTSGLEWNLKITAQEIPHIIEKSLNTFEAYWESDDFEDFDGEVESKEKLKQALVHAKGSYATNTSHYFDLKPFPHQQEILERLSVERDLHGRFRNLVVAATGTGKTLISAFDFSRYLNKNPNAKFLFIAHKEEILRQARSSFRGVLRNNAFGEMWVGGETPEHYQQLFVSIQTLNNQLDNLNLSKDYYDYVVIDEVHHIAANSYRTVLDAFLPKILLGLTATPERHDGSDILSDFCGVIAAELRLPEAINRRYLCPFQYFGIDDDTDLRTISWQRGRYDVGQLTKIYTNNQIRVNKIHQSLVDIVTDIRGMRALAFCVSREHADYMCKQFLLRKIPCDVLTSDNSIDRQLKQQAIRSGQINILFVVDIFNEGVDIPEVDTLLFLRPTESLTIFLQQLGRGLRHAEGKECCTILDFVGNSRSEYDFSQKFRALVGKTNKAISEEIKQGFPHAPLGCRIELSKRTQELVLENIRRATINVKKLINLIRNFRHESDLDLTLSNFLNLYPNINLEDIYKRGTWSDLVNKALNLQVNEPTDDKVYQAYATAIDRRLMGCDCAHYLKFLQRLCRAEFSLTADMDVKMALMCHYDFWQKTGKELGFESLAESLKRLNKQDLRTELLDVLGILINRLQHEQTPMTGFGDNPIYTHARYQREQILIGFGVTTFVKQISAREGVFHISSENVELLFVTLDKNEKKFSPTTMYHDYAISESRFHWQSQNSARPDRGKGLSYIQHKSTGKRIILFVREQSEDEYGRTMGFVNFGEVEYISHTGSQPMNITWRLKNDMPTFMWKQAAKLAVG